MLLSYFKAPLKSEIQVRPCRANTGPCSLALVLTFRANKTKPSTAAVQRHLPQADRVAHRDLDAKGHDHAGTSHPAPRPAPVVVLTRPSFCVHLQALTKVCSNPQTLVDLFLNYDCDVNGDDLFESMVNVISHVTRTIRPTDNGDAATVAEVCPMRLFQCSVRRFCFGFTRDQPPRPRAGSRTPSPDPQDQVARHPRDGRARALAAGVDEHDRGSRR